MTGAAGGGWSEVAVGGRRAHLFEPAGPVRRGVLFLHPYGGETLFGNAAFTRLLAERSCACLSPLGARSWWADRVCDEFDPSLTPERYLLDAAEPWCRARWGVRAVGLLGISMGGQGVLRLALKHPHRFPAAAGIASAVDYHIIYGRGEPVDGMYDSREQCRQDTAPLHVRPDRPAPKLFFAIDPDDTDWFRGNDRLHEKLSALGVEHTCDLTTRAGGHTWQYFERMGGPALDFLARELEQPARRLM